MQDLIFVSMENWDDVWRRNQFLCAGLSRRFPDSKILFVGLPRNATNDLRHGRMPDLSAADTTVPDLPGITLTRPLKLLPDTLGWGRRLNETLFRAHLRRAARRLGMQSPILWLNPHSAVHMAGQMGESAVVYDITDDWTMQIQSPAMTRLTIDQDAALCRRADAVVVCSERLRDMKRGLAKDLYLIPNGVDAEHYRAVLDGTGPLPAPADTWAKPVLGYTGTIHPERVDVPLVESLARRFSSGTIALVGPNMLPAEDRQRLAACGNVVLTGPVPYAHIPETMRAFDVCITPHRMTAFTESLNPIKLWEYFAAGKPIVSTNVAGFRDYPQFVRLASDADSFRRAVEDALTEDPASGEARRAEARCQSWNARLEQIIEVLQSFEHASLADKKEVIRAS
ncbi:MAG: glycosyltransferase [Janthinobacterium lividum]